MATNIGGGVTYLTRADWGANPLVITRGHVAVPTQWKRTVFHHTVIIDNDATPNLWTNLAEVKAKMRQLQHIRPDLGSEVPYSFVLFLMEDGTLVVCEGRGTRRTGAHTIGHNSTWLGVAFEGDFENFTQDIRRWIPRVNHFAWWIRKQGCRNLRSPFMVHQDTSQTACPGSEIISRRVLFSYAERAQEVEAMAFAFKVAGRGTTVFVDTGTDIRRVTSGAALGRMKRHGIVPNKPAPTITQDEYGKLLRDRQQN